MSSIGRLSGTLIGLPGRPRERRCLDAAVAAAALVASADGPVTADRRRLLARMLESVDEMRAFDARLAADAMDHLARLIRGQGERGRARAVQAVGEIAGDAEAAAFVLRIACAMAQDGGGPSRAARKRVEAVAAAAGLPAPALDGPETGRGGATAGRPSVIAMGSDKGGTGKSTAALHLAVALVKRGHQVGAVDLDGGQGTLSRYLANRVALAEESGRALGLPRPRRIEPSARPRRDLAEAEEAARLAETLAGLGDCAYVVIDTPGHDCHLSRLACAHADVLITPLNDSLIDLETLARIDRRRREVLGPSDYSRRVWDENDRRVAAGRRTLDWIVMRNRLGHVGARNNREVSTLLARLAPRLGFRLVRGLSERVVFRELFLQGLTVLDLPEAGEAAAAPGRSHAHARREIDELLAAAGLPPARADPVAALPLFGAGAE